MTASLIIDVILVLIAGILLIKYARKGFLKTVLDFLKTIIAIVLAYVLRVPVAKFIDSLFMNKSIVGWVRNSLSAIANGENSVVDFASIYKDAPMFYNNVLSKFGINLENLSEQFETLLGAEEEVINSMALNIGSALSYMLSTVVAVLVVFVLAIIVLTVVVHFLNLLTKFEAINVINKILGLIFGVALSAVIMWGISLGVLKAIEFFGPMYPDVLNDEIINGSVILKFFCENNLLNIVLGWFGKA